MALFDKILIANRGEIACRIIRTAHRMGIAAIAVHSEADREALHVRMADESHHIGAAEAAKSYLCGEAILEAARRAGADAIHPGYGFLSENAGFAEAVEAAGIRFIGPRAASIRQMGLKDAAKTIMEKAGVPVTPGYHGEDQTPQGLAAEAERIGYPVLIKAVAGGGGKGMRRVDAAGDFAKALAGAQREAKNAFGDERVLLEKFLLRPRHIEVQVFGDRFGNVVHLFERDCSIQRRHQKVIEEAPAPDMPEAMRKAMGEAALAAAGAIDYCGAGTVEFIADISDGLREDRFYFMEMNTRLQVEHPVTEMILGQDLVAWQIRVAAGEALPLTQADLAISGHAIEARLYAENPARMFLPATGCLDMLRFPPEGDGRRIDTGVGEGDTVTPHYDPMLAKLVAHGKDRAEAAHKLAAMLAGTRIAGLTTNLAFLRRVVTHPGFAAGDLDTGFIERFGAELLAPVAAADADSPAQIALAVLAILAARDATHHPAHATDPFSPWDARDGWRLNDHGHEVIHLRHDGRESEALVHYGRGGALAVAFDGDSMQAEYRLEAPGELSAVLDGHGVRLSFHMAGRRLTLVRGGVASNFEIIDPMEIEMPDEATGGAITAPLPGKIIKLTAKPDARVAKGDPLMILEAMKMEHVIVAPAAGVIAEIRVGEGDQVVEGAALIDMKPE